MFNYTDIQIPRCNSSDIHTRAKNNWYINLIAGKFTTRVKDFKNTAKHSSFWKSTVDTGYSAVFHNLGTFRGPGFLYSVADCVASITFRSQSLGKKDKILTQMNIPINIVRLGICMKVHWLTGTSPISSA